MLLFLLFQTQSFENIQRPITHTTKLLIKYYGFSADKSSDCPRDCSPYRGSSPDNESVCAEHCLPGKLIKCIL